MLIHYDVYCTVDGYIQSHFIILLVVDNIINITQ